MEGDQREKEYYGLRISWESEVSHKSQKESVLFMMKWPEEFPLAQGVIIHDFVFNNTSYHDCL